MDNRSKGLPRAIARSSRGPPGIGPVVSQDLARAARTTADIDDAGRGYRRQIYRRRRPVGGPGHRGGARRGARRGAWSQTAKAGGGIGPPESRRLRLGLPAVHYSVAGGKLLYIRSMQHTHIRRCHPDRRRDCYLKQGGVQLRTLVVSRIAERVTQPNQVAWKCPLCDAGYSTDSAARYREASLARARRHHKTARHAQVQATAWRLAMRGQAERR